MSAQTTGEPEVIARIRLGLFGKVTPHEVLEAYDTAIAQRDEAVQRCEWVATALHGDPMYGPGSDEPLVQQVNTLRAKLAAAEADRDRYRKWLSDVDNAERERFTSALAAHHLAFVTPRTPTPPQEATNDDA